MTEVDRSKGGVQRPDAPPTPIGTPRYRFWGVLGAYHSGARENQSVHRTTRACGVSRPLAALLRCVGQPPVNISDRFRNQASTPNLRHAFPNIAQHRSVSRTMAEVAMSPVW